MAMGSVNGIDFQIGSARIETVETLCGGMYYSIVAKDRRGDEVTIVDGPHVEICGDLTKKEAKAVDKFCKSLSLYNEE